MEIKPEDYKQLKVLCYNALQGSKYSSIEDLKRSSKGSYLLDLVELIPPPVRRAFITEELTAYLSDTQIVEAVRKICEEMKGGGYKEMSKQTLQKLGKAFIQASKEANAVLRGSNFDGLVGIKFNEELARHKDIIEASDQAWVAFISAYETFKKEEKQGE